MAINILIGAPGGGKSYEAVAYHVLPALESGRKVITNLPIDVDRMNAVVPGSAALIDIRTETKATKPAPVMKSVFGVQRDVGGASTWINRPFAHVGDYADDWRDEEGRGPLYVIDECHFALPAGRTDKAVEEWYSMHRHYNVDVLLITQSYGKCSKAIIDLVQVCYKVRKATMLGNTGGYIRKVLDGVRGGEISVQQRKYEKRYFGLYRSHTHGTALAEKDPADVSPLAVKFKRFQKVYWVFAIIYIAWAFWPSDGEKKDSPPKEVSVQGHRDQPVKLPQASLAVPDRPVEVAHPERPARQASRLLGPMMGKGLHVTGEMHMGSKMLVTFVLTDNGQRIYNTTSIELEQAGYKVSSIAPCVARVEYAGEAVMAVCDAPLFGQGSQSMPIVVDSATGARSDGRHRQAAAPVKSTGQRDYFDFVGAAISAPRPQTAVQAVRAAAS